MYSIKREVNYYKSMLEILDFKQEAAQQEKKKIWLHRTVKVEL